MFKEKKMDRQQFVKELWILYERASQNCDWDAALMFLQKISEHEPNTKDVGNGTD